MEINITGKNIKITSGIRDYINKKITKVVSSFEHPINCDIVVEVEKNRHMIEIILSGDSGRFYFKKEAFDLYAAVDNAIQTALGSIKKFKEKQKNHKFKSRENFERRGEFKGGKIRVKKIDVKDIKPMTTEEAVLQLRYIRQNILVFQNAKNFKTFILYKNNDEYNLICPKISFLKKFIFFGPKKNLYNVTSLFYNNDKKIKAVKRKNILFNTLTFQQAYNKIMNIKGLDYLIFNNSDYDKISILFRINKFLIGYYEY